MPRVLIDDMGTIKGCIPVLQEAKTVILIYSCMFKIISLIVSYQSI